jgi:putative DNA primase/helicase
MSTAKEIADLVNERVADLLPEDDRQPLDDQFIKDCLDANERGDGCMYASLCKDRFLYNTTPKDGEWYCWAGHVWERDEFQRSKNAVEECALEYQRMIPELQKEVEEKDIDKKHPEAWKFHLLNKYKSRVDKLRTVQGMNKVLTYAPIVDESIACKEHDFDKMPWLLPVQNGVIDLQTGALGSGRPGDMMSKALDLNYDPHADYTEWHKTIVEISGGEEVAAFLKRSFGYAITGFSHEQYIWVFLGAGRNGKGIMFNMIGEVMGPFYHEINKAMLIEQRNEPGANAASEHLYSLLGKRIITGSETNKGQKIDCSAVKELTGENQVKCRPNFKSEVRFFPTHSLFLQTNHPPYGLTSDFAMVQRLLLIDFPYRYVDDVEAEKKKYPRHADIFRKKDKDLKKRLREQKAGILRWLVEGCLEWQQLGLCPPQSVTDGVSALANEEDYIGQFINDCLEHFPDQSDLRLPCTAMYDAFEWWFQENIDQKEQRIPAMKTVNKSLRDRGYDVEPKGGKTWIWGMIIKFEIAEEVAEFAKKRRKS